MPFRPEFNSPHLQNLKVDGSQSAKKFVLLFFQKKKNLTLKDESQTFFDFSSLKLGE